MEYEVSFTFFIGIGECKDERKQSILKKDELLDLLDEKSEIVSYDVENDGEDWCINCIANVTANKIDGLLSDTNTTWDYHYIKGIDTDEYWEP